MSHTINAAAFRPGDTVHISTDYHRRLLCLCRNTAWLGKVERVTEDGTVHVKWNNGESHPHSPHHLENVDR